MLRQLRVERKPLAGTSVVASQESLPPPPRRILHARSWHLADLSFAAHSPLAPSGRAVFGAPPDQLRLLVRFLAPLRLGTINGRQYASGSRQTTELGALRQRP